MRDQAERLRQIAENYKAEILANRTPVHQRRARVLAVTSGKGGVGKTNVSVNLAYALIEQGNEVTVLDADLGLANVDVLVGTVPQRHLGHVVAGSAGIADVVYTAPGNLKLIAGGSGVGDLADLPEMELHRFIQSLRQLESTTDFLVIDTGAGLGRSVTNFLLAADCVLLVTTPEPTAMTDAYALIKTLVRRNPAIDIKLVVNQAETRDEAEVAAGRLAQTVLRFLGASIEFVATIPDDREVPRSVRNQRPFFLSSPHAPASMAIRELASKLTGAEAETRAGIGLFFDRLTRVFSRWR